MEAEQEAKENEAKKLAKMNADEKKDHQPVILSKN